MFVFGELVRREETAVGDVAALVRPRGSAWSGPADLHREEPQKARLARRLWRMSLSPDRMPRTFVKTSKLKSTGRVGRYRL